MLVFTPAVCVLVLLLIASVSFVMDALSELDAVCTSESVAREPAVRPAPVRVRVAADQTSVASVPKVVRLRDPKAQTCAGIEVIMLPIEVEAFET